jgi:transposase InsO family protein
MGVIIQAESHRNELAGIYEYEHDAGTVEYYDQPPPIKLVYAAKSGRRVAVVHTPDFFVLRTDTVGWEEWKMEEELGCLAEAMPQRYGRGDDGNWHCPPGEACAQPFGFFYRVRSSAEIDWVFQRNLLFLEDYLRTECPPVDERMAEAFRSLVARQPGLRLSDLLAHGAGVRSDDVYRLIATERLHVDLHAAALAEPDRVRVYRDVASAQAAALVAATTAPSWSDRVSDLTLRVGAAVAWDGREWTIVNVGQTATALLAADGTLVELPTATLEALVDQGKIVGGTASAGISRTVRERLAQASPEDFAEANRRYALIAPQLVGDPARVPGVPARTVRRWLSRWRAAEQQEQCGYVGLLPRGGRRGNRTRKLPEATSALLDQFILAAYETLTQKSRFAVYAALTRACEEQGLAVPSYKTFALAVKRRPRQEQVAKRQGPRAAAQEAPFYWELALTTPRHGDRPWEIAHIDHTQLDLELVCSRTGRPLGRPWATLLSDAFSRRLLAVCLTFDCPSYRSCMLVLRACVQRHQRLPQTIVVDGGAEFAGVYFETLLARYGCAKKTRPGARPRFGSVCERLFGTTNTRFVHNLVGNTQICRTVRQVTKAVAPKAQACWTLAALAVRLDEWAYEVYDTLDHPALGQSPREAFAAGLVQGGERRHRRILDDEDFRMLTLPSTSRGMARLQRRLGVKLHRIYYWSDAFLDAALEHTSLPVRFDPFDAGVAYAFVKGRWVRCISEYYARFAGRSEREIQLATMELRRRHQCHAQHFTVTARKLAEFLVSLEAEEALLEQRLRDAALREVLASRPPTVEAGASDGEGATGLAPSAAANASRVQESDGPAVDRSDAATLIIYGDY